MRVRDRAELAAGNLWRMKLRTLLTVAGVVIAIATFVAMLSFAAGNHRYFSEAFAQFGLLSSMNVYPPDEDEEDGETAATLDAAAVADLDAIPGVAMAYPFESFTVSATCADSTVSARVRALPPAALETTLFDNLLGGARFTDGDDRVAIVTRAFAELVGVENPDSLVGRTLVLETRVARLDSGLVAAFGKDGEDLLGRAREVRFDSLQVAAYRRDLLRREAGEGFDRFIGGFLRRQAMVADTLTIGAVGADTGPYDVRMAPIVIPERTARRFESSGLNLGGDPAGLLALLRGGRLFATGGASDGRSYPRVTLDLQPLADHAAVADSVEALGFRAFSYAEQFDTMQRFMLYYYAGLGVIGLIAMVTAALGIVNTLVMSVNERRREIGLLKSLGADDGDVRGIYLVESVIIGAVGAALGIACGWLGTRVASAVMRGIMAREELLVFDPFVLPAWLIGTAVVFGIVVSLVAGLFPAGRAAAVDPVTALRGE